MVVNVLKSEWILLLLIQTERLLLPFLQNDAILYALFSYQEFFFKINCNYYAKATCMIIAYDAMHSN